MICSQCGREMENGYVYALSKNSGIWWLPKAIKWKRMYNPRHLRNDGCIQLGPGALLAEGCSFPASICRCCKIGHFSFDNEVSH